MRPSSGTGVPPMTSHSSPAPGMSGALWSRRGLSPWRRAARSSGTIFFAKRRRSWGSISKSTQPTTPMTTRRPFFFNLIRGTGVAGLTGMAYQQNGICRPLLDVTREELAAYAAARHIPHVEDTTNADPGAAARNFLRLEVMPRLRQINPRAVEHINDAGRRLRVADQSLEEEAARRTAHVEVQEGRVTLSRQDWQRPRTPCDPGCCCGSSTFWAWGGGDITAAHLQGHPHLTRDTLWGRESRVDLPQGVTARYCRGVADPGDPAPAFDGGPAVAGVPPSPGAITGSPCWITGRGGTCPSALAAGGSGWA